MLNFEFHYFPGWVVGWVVGWVGVGNENKANSVQLELELGLSLAKKTELCFHLFLLKDNIKL